MTDAERAVMDAERTLNEARARVLANNALLPCPFCGAAAEAWVVDTDGGSLYAAAGCRSRACGVKPVAVEHFGLRINRERGERIAKSTWNERVGR